MKIRHKLPVAFAAVSLFIALIASFGIYRLDQSIHRYAELIRVDVQSEQAVADMLIAFKTQVQEWKNVLIRGKDTQQLDKHWAAFQKHEQEVAAAAKALDASLPDGEARALLAQFVQAHAAMGAGYRKGFEAFKAAGLDPAAGDAAVKGMDRAPSELLSKAKKQIGDGAKASAARTEQAGNQARLLSFVLMLAGVGGAIVCGVVISRSFTRPLQKVVDVANTVAAGDLSRQIVVTTKDETGEMLQALQNMNASLAGTVARVRAVTDAICTASSQIAAGNLDLAARTDEQSNALQLTASSMEEQTAAVQRNAENAVQANQLAQSASQVAVQGGEIVAKVVTTMGSIEQSANKIVDIISVIDGIAFQTNILALNAAVEAARAGEQGRGFAVVASEVRTLAQRSASAAREIKALIEESVQNVGVGSQLVNEAGATMAEVVGSILRVTQIMTQITEATAEQSQGIAHVNQAISRMDEVTQKNAVLVEESAAAADAMKGQASGLAEVVSVFRLA